jgi:hypothetical protein
MKTENRLDGSFGPAGTTAGIIVFVAGLALAYFHLTGLILAVIGAFAGFTNTSVLIDTDKKSVKFSNNLFGFIRTGKWVSLEPSMKVGIKKLNQTYSAYSQGNREHDITGTDFRICLFDAAGREIMPLKKFTSPDAALVELDTFKKEFGLEGI